MQVNLIKILILINKYPPSETTNYYYTENYKTYFNYYYYYQKFSFMTNYLFQLINNKNYYTKINVKMD